MISIEMLDIILAIGEDELIEDILLTLLTTAPLSVFFKKFPKLQQKVRQEFPRWRERLKIRLKDEYIPEKLAQEVLCYQQSLTYSHHQLMNKRLDIIGLLQKASSPFYEQALSLLTNTSPITPTIQTLFLQRWRASLILQATSLNREFLEDEQNKLLAEIQKRLDLSGMLDSTLAENEAAAGKLWDMSAGTLTQGNYQQIVHYSEFLTKQPELMQLAQRLGRAYGSQLVHSKDVTAETKHALVREPETIPEQVNGIQHSDDILRLLPPELVTLGIADIEYDFYRKLVEKQLLTYRLHGDTFCEKIVEHPVIHKKNKDKQPGGPFIVCVDTSGSMGKFNEHCAKAFCLALMRIALADNRQCFIILFSSEVVGYDVCGDKGIEHAIRFLSQHFQGGTDLACCLKNVIEKLKEKKWHEADVVVLSDFIANRLPDDVVNHLKTLQQEFKHRFHAVAMSSYGKPGIMRIFDHIWHFDTGIRSRILRHWRR